MSADAEIVLRPTRGLGGLNAGEIWAYRDLVWLLAWRDIAVRYKQTVLGPLWFVLQPVLTTLVFTVVFGKVARIPTAGVPPVLFYLCGLVGWNYFAQTFQATSATLVGNAALFGKVYFPRLVVPLSIVVSNLVPFAIQLLTFAAFFVGFKLTDAAGRFAVQPSIALFPLVVVHLAALSLGVGLWFTALNAKYRDFGFVAGFVLQLWLFVTPVIYPLSSVPARWRGVASLNPVTMPIESLRHMLLDGGDPDPALIAISLGITALVLVTGLLVFRRVERTFVDTV